MIKVYTRYVALMVQTEMDIYHDNGRLSFAVGPDSERPVL